MSKSLLNRIEALERAVTSNAPTVIIRHFSSEHAEAAPCISLSVGEQTFYRNAGESEEDFIARAERLAPIVNGMRILHESR